MKKQRQNRRRELLHRRSQPPRGQSLPPLRPNTAESKILNSLPSFGVDIHALNDGWVETAEATE